MRKQTKLAVGLSAAALLAIGASMTSFASGWVQEGDEWYYVDNNGDYVEDKWKLYNGQYFYLGDDGAMLTNELVEDNNNYYYVDANGAMVKNTWVAIAADEDEDQDVDYRWYYFGSTGKAYKGNGSSVSTKTINGKKYAFDEDGKMLFGFVDEAGTILNEEDVDPALECKYYFGTNDDGAMYTGWLRYEDGFETTDEYDDYEYVWFYFNKGEKLGPKTAKKISGKYYSFDDFGVMITSWSQEVDSTAAAAATLTAYKFYVDDLTDGSQVRDAWIWAALPEDIEEDGDEHWFRTLKNGELVADQTKKVNSKWYVFNENGVMQYGLLVLDSATINEAHAVPVDGLTKNSVTSYNIDQDAKRASDIYANLPDGEYLYYFSSSESEDGSAKTGTYTLSLADDDYTFGFKKSKYMGMEGEESKKAYLSGIRQEAGDQKYAVVYMGHNDGDCIPVLVNSTGTIQTSTSKYYKDDDEYYYVLKKNDDQVEYTQYGEKVKYDSYTIYKFGEKDDAKACISDGTTTGGTLVADGQNKGGSSDD